MVGRGPIEVAKTVLEVADVAWTAVECRRRHQHEHEHEDSEETPSEEELECMRSENRRLRNLLEQNLKLLQNLSESPCLLQDCPPDLYDRLVATVESEKFLTQLKSLHDESAAIFTTRRTVASLVSRALSSSSSRSRFALPLLHKHPQLVPNSVSTIPTRSKTSGYSPLNDPSPNWSNRPPKETILLDGCDYEHWLIVMEFPSDPKPSEDDMINSYVNTLSQVLGSEEEAKKKIYSVCTTTYTGFGALISEELSYKVKGLPGVLWVLPDSYLDVPNKDYGGDLFIDGKVIHRPQYRYNERQQTRNRPRPRYDRRRETMQTERREPLRRGAGAQDQRGPMQQQVSMDGQNMSESGGGPSVHQGGSQGSSA